MVLTSNVPSRQTQHLSPRALELNRKLEETIDTFRRYYPDTSDADVRNALRSAGAAHAGGTRRAAAVTATVGGLVLAVVGVLAFDNGLPVVSATVWAGIAVAFAGALVTIARLVNRS